MDSDPVSYVKPCNSLLIKIKHDKITGILITKLRAISNLDVLKDSLELLKYACLITENLLYGKRYKNKISVKDVIFAAFEKVFGNNYSKSNVENNMIFLYENQQILPSNNSTKLFEFLKKWFSNKKKKY